MDTANRKKFGKHLDFFIVDIFVICLSYLLAFLIKKSDLGVELYRRYFIFLFAFIFAFLCIISFWKIYSGILRRRPFDEIKQILAVNAGIFFIIGGFLIFTKRTEDYSRVFLFLFFCFDITFMCLSHLIYRKLLHKKHARSKSRGKMLLISTLRDSQMFVKNIVKHNSGEFDIIGIWIVDGTLEQSDICEVPVITMQKDIAEFVIENGVGNVMMHVKTMDMDRLQSRLMDLGVNVYTTLLVLGSGGRRYQAERINGYDVLSGETIPTPIGQLFFKRIFDIVFSAAALILLSPVYVCLAICIKREDHGPVFYVSKRIGKGGKVIGIHKFRSMKIGSDNLEESLSPEQLEEYYKEYKLDDDPRCTSIGAFMRKTSLDELPQFWDVLVGRLSLVGPRPVIEAETRLYGDQRSLFLSVKPGLTGYWQSRGRNNITYESGERQSMELYYVENHTLYMDIKIIFWTIGAVLKRDGAK